MLDQKFHNSNSTSQFLFFSSTEFCLMLHNVYKIPCIHSMEIIINGRCNIILISCTVKKKKKKLMSLKSRSTKWQMVKFQQLKRSKTLWAFNEWNMPRERDLLSINPNRCSLIKPSYTVSEYVDTRLQHFLIIFNFRHIFPFNWHSEMPLQSYQIGTKFSREITTHFWILIHLIETVISKLFFKWKVWERFTPHSIHNTGDVKVICIWPTFMCTFLCSEALHSQTNLMKP